jgi:MtfA peptidase
MNVKYVKRFGVAPGSNVKLKEIDPGFKNHYESHKEAAEEIEHDRKKLFDLQESLLGGFDNLSSKDNVGVHEFVHLVEHEEAEHGLPPEVPWQAVKHWEKYVAQELSHPPKNHAYINSYTYTNEHEFFAVLAEYFFKSPDLLQRKDPQLYAMLREMFHQDTGSLLKLPALVCQRYGRNAPCPCGSGKKYRHCCLLKAVEAKASGEKAA